jgi:hypothetical protein
MALRTSSATVTPLTWATASRVLACSSGRRMLDQISRR